MTAMPCVTRQQRVLLTLTAAVLLAHLAVLRGTPMALGLSQHQATRVFATRAIAPVPVVQTSAERPATPQLTPPPKPAAPATARHEAPATPSASGEAAPQPPAAQGEMPDPAPAQVAATPTVTHQAEPPAEADQPASAPRPPRDQLSPVGAFILPGSVRISYKVEANKFPFSARAELLWQQGSENYEARLELSAFGLTRLQTSRGRLTPAGLAPLRFSDKYRSEVAAHFEREKGKVTFSANTPDVPLLAGAQDRLSVLVQLAAMIAGNPGLYPQATTIAIQTIGPRDADTWLFTVGKEETLTLPGGEQATLKLVRNPRQAFDQKVELWLAPALGYLPARIRITEPNGDFIDQQWLSTEPQV